MSKEPQVASPLPEKDRLAGALDTIAQLVLGKELAAIRHEMTEQNSGVFRRVEALREDSTRLLEQLKTDSRTRADELREKIASGESGLQKALGELDNRVKRGSEELRGELREARAHGDTRVAECRQALEAELETRETQLGERIDALARDLASVHFELQQVSDSNQRVAAVLSNLAGVLTGSPVSLGGAAIAAAAKSPAAAAEMDSAVDKLFESGPASAVKTR